MDKIYTPTFFANLRESSLNSAKVIVPILLEAFHPTSVVDVGCGDGAWLSVFKEKGIDSVLGIDGDYVDRGGLLINSNEFLSQDLIQPIHIGQKFEVALCLEVAEHLPQQYADRLIASLVKLSDVIAFSAAIPYQGGSYHVNEQLPEYWIDKFARHKYSIYDVIRPHIWGNEQVAFWYQQNFLLFINDDRQSEFKHLQNDSIYRAHNYLLVHPKTYMTLIRRLQKAENSPKGLVRRAYDFATRVAKKLI